LVGDRPAAHDHPRAANFHTDLDCNSPAQRYPDQNGDPTPERYSYKDTHSSTHPDANAKTINFVIRFWGYGLLCTPYPQNRIYKLLVHPLLKLLLQSSFACAIIRFWSNENQTTEVKDANLYLSV
jgi:hypothetical protein